MSKKLSVFLGGTCANSTWRDELITKLNENIEPFNPVVANWSPDDQAIEDKHKLEDDISLYVFTPESLASPQRGLYSIAEAVDDSNKRPEKTIFAFVDYGGLEFTPKEVQGLKAVAKVISSNGARVVSSLDDVAEILNTK